MQMSEGAISVGGVISHGEEEGKTRVSGRRVTTAKYNLVDGRAIPREAITGGHLQTSMLTVTVGTSLDDRPPKPPRLPRMQVLGSTDEVNFPPEQPTSYQPEWEIQPGLLDSPLNRFLTVYLRRGSRRTQELAKSGIGINVIESGNYPGRRVQVAIIGGR